MTTEVAFKLMLSTRGVSKKLGIARGTVAKMRSDLRKGISKVSLDKKYQYLAKAGFVMRQDTRWIIAANAQEQISDKAIDYLNDYPFLTLLGRFYGYSDADIKKKNEVLVKDLSILGNAYKHIA